MALTDEQRRNVVAGALRRAEAKKQASESKVHEPAPPPVASLLSPLPAKK